MKRSLGSSRCVWPGNFYGPNFSLIPIRTVSMEGNAARVVEMNLVRLISLRWIRAFNFSVRPTASVTVCTTFLVTTGFLEDVKGTFKMFHLFLEPELWDTFLLFLPIRVLDYVRISEVILLMTWPSRSLRAVMNSIALVDCCRNESYSTPQTAVQSEGFGRIWWGEYHIWDRITLSLCAIGFAARFDLMSTPV